MDLDTSPETAPVREKRPAESTDAGSVVGEAREMQEKTKKARAGPMRSVAETVLVLSAMAKMRGGGRSPTPAEKELMAGARAEAAVLCGALAPKDVVPRDAIRIVLEDLGLGNPGDRALEFRPSPKMSIAEKMSSAQRQMEESKVLVAHSALSLSQRPQTNSGAVTANHATSNTVHLLPSNKVSHTSISPGAIRSASSFGKVPAATSAPFPCPPPSNKARPHTVSNGFPISQSGKDSFPSFLTKSERPQAKLDGGINGISFTPQIRAIASSDHSPAKAPMWSVQPLSAPMAKTGPENQVSDYVPARVEGAIDRSASKFVHQASSDQTSKTAGAQATSGSQPHQTLQMTNYVHAHHIEISRRVQQWLKSQLPHCPTWTPPSRDYMNKALTCQICMLSINDVVSALVCDACENGYHLKCIAILSPNQKGILKVEWHCPRCLALSKGKPLHPKYGCVTRNMTASKMSFSTSGVQSVPEKVVNLEQVNKQKITTNENSGVQDPLAAAMGPTCTLLAFDTNNPNAREVQVNNLFSNRKIKDDAPISRSCLNNSMNTTPEEVVNSDHKVSQQKISVNENSGVQDPLAATMGPTRSVLAFDTSNPNAREVQLNSLLSNKRNKDHAPDSRNCLNNSVNATPEKLVNSGNNVTQQKISINENSGVLPATMDTNSNVLEFDKNKPNARELQGDNLLSNKQRKDDRSISGSCLNNSMSSSPEKVLNSEPRVNLQKITTNENSSVHGPLAATKGSNCTELAFETNKPNPREVQGNSMLLHRQTISNRPRSGSCLNNTVNSLGSEAPPSEKLAEKSTPHVHIAESIDGEQRSDFESKSQPPVKLSNTIVDTVDCSQAPGMASVKQYYDNNPIAEALDTSLVKETIDCKASNGQDAVRACLSETREMGSGTG